MLSEPDWEGLKGRCGFCTTIFGVQSSGFIILTQGSAALHPGLLFNATSGLRLKFQVSRAASCELDQTGGETLITPKIVAQGELKSWEIIETQKKA